MSQQCQHPYLYRKIPEVVEAYQLTKERWNNRESWPYWLIRAARENKDLGPGIWLSDNYEEHFLVDSDKCVYVGNWNDWIIRDGDSFLRPVAPAVFEKNYQPFSSTGVPD